ncbi:WD40/YVTN repeat-like-containing domain superfamily [Sesbania bispinosa]|nr:WD40/YVTN repeat-like-containing domain superfamily [Sesbania bispinosa]
MPRTITLECPGCPRLRALTFDTLGLIKGVPRVVERWGEPESSKCVVAVSMIDRKSHPLLAVARKSGQIEVLSPVNGDSLTTISNTNDLDLQSEENDIVCLHLFAKQNFELPSRSCTLLTCTAKGNASIRSIEGTDSSTGSSCTGSSKTWNPPKNSLGIFTPTWFTSATFLRKDDHRKFVAGTHNHQVRLYDISAQRRPVLSFDFRETPIKALAEDIDGYSIYIGNGSGDMAAVDIRTGKMLGGFSGKCSGSKSIVRHPELPVIASCGLDSYLRLWDMKTRQLLSAVFLKQHLLHVLFDSSFIVEEMSSRGDLPPCKEQNPNEITVREEDEATPLKRKKSSKTKENIIDNSERKKRSKKSEECKKSKGNDGHEKIASRVEGSKSASKKRSKSSKREIQDEGL